MHISFVVYIMLFYKTCIEFAIKNWCFQRHMGYLLCRWMTWFWPVEENVRRHHCMVETIYSTLRYMVSLLRYRPTLHDVAAYLLRDAAVNELVDNSELIIDT